MKILKLTFAGPRMSWSYPSLEDLRPTGHFPSFSNMIGIFGAALGIERGDIDNLTKILNSFKYAVRLNNQIEPKIQTDFHTASGFEGARASNQQKKSWRIKNEYPGAFILNDSLYGWGEDGKDREIPKKFRKTDGSTMTNRQYILDASYTVLISENNGGYTLTDLAEALANPIFPIYFGRKCCIPTIPLLDKDSFLESEDFLTAFNSVPIPKSIKEVKGPQQSAIWGEDNKEAIRKIIVRDIPMFNRARGFHERTVYMKIQN